MRKTGFIANQAVFSAGMPKLQFVTRYDQFIPDRNKSNDIRREYSAGVNYFIKGQALKIMLNYVFCQNDLFKDSHRIILGTQLIL